MCFLILCIEITTLTNPEKNMKSAFQTLPDGNFHSLTDAHRQFQADMKQICPVRTSDVHFRPIIIPEENRSEKNSNYLKTELNATYKKFMSTVQAKLDVKHVEFMLNVQAELDEKLEDFKQKACGYGKCAPVEEVRLKINASRIEFLRRNNTEEDVEAYRKLIENSYEPDIKKRLKLEDILFYRLSTDQKKKSDRVNLYHAFTNSSQSVYATTSVVKEEDDGSDYTEDMEDEDDSDCIGSPNKSSSNRSRAKQRGEQSKLCRQAARKNANGKQDGQAEADSDRVSKKDKTKKKNLSKKKAAERIAKANGSH